MPVVWSFHVHVCGSRVHKTSCAPAARKNTTRHLGTPVCSSLPFPINFLMKMIFLSMFDAMVRHNCQCFRLPGSNRVHGSNEMCQEVHFPMPGTHSRTFALCFGSLLALSTGVANCVCQRRHQRALVVWEGRGERVLFCRFDPRARQQKYLSFEHGFFVLIF